MRASVGRSLVLQGGLLILMAVLLYAFFQRSQLDNEEHRQRVAVLLQAKELDAQFDQVALQILTSTLHQYDPLTSLYSEEESLHHKLDAEGVFASTNPEILSQAANFGALLHQKLEYIERLKTRSAIVRNGLLYLPTLGGELQHHPYNVIASPSSYVNKLLSFSYLRGAAERESLNQDIAKIRRWLHNHPDDQSLANFLLHIESSLKGQQVLADLRAAFLAVPSKQAFSQLSDQYRASYRQQIAETQKISLQLLVGCLLLMALVILILRRLDSARLAAENASKTLHDAVESLNEGFALYSPDGKLLLHNQRWKELYALDENNLMPASLDDWRQRQCSYIRQEGSTVNGGEDFSLQVTPAGKWLQASDAETSNGGTVCIRVDISDIKLAEHQLRKQGRAIDQSSGAILITDREGIIEYANPRFSEVTGYSSEDVIGNKPNLLQQGSTSLEGREGLWEAIRDGLAWQGEYLSQRSNGQNYWESASISPIRDEADQLTNFVIVTEDITQEKLASDNLRMAAAVFDATQEGIMTTDPELRITAVNPAFCEITGYEEHEVIGQKPSVLSSGRHDKAFYEQMWRTIRHEGAWSSEIWNRKKDGTVYPQWLSISAVRNEHDAIQQYVSVLTDISERKAQEEQIHYQAYYDALTGLPNRALLVDRLEHDLHLAKRNNQIGSLLFIDLDRFKRVNDTMGHEVGDHLLTQVADRLSGLIRASDTLSRFGGDEFVILLSDIPEAQHAAVVAEKIVEAMQQPFNLNGKDLVTGASIGIAMAPADADQATELLRLSDLAMYKAKESGRNQFQFFAKTMQDKVNRRVLLEQQLREALEQEQLEVYYQPIIASDSHQCEAVEALARWNHPVEGMIPPAEFIPVAEESGLIAQIGEWVLQQACTQVAQWHAEGVALKLSVNLSSQQYHLGFNASVLGEILERSGLPGAFLSLEITESILLENDSEILSWLDSLRRQGVSLSIDDFGTGYSSLSYLKRFPITTLKIDRSFVADMNIDSGACSLVEAIIAMARSLKLKVIAEGVETAEQFAVLEDMGCDCVQGFYFAKPMPAELLLETMQLPATTD